MSTTEGRGISVTIKWGKGYEDTWAVFRGDPEGIRSQIVEFFGFMCESVTELTLSELVVEATSIAHGTGNIARYLGGTIVPQSELHEPQAGDPWAAATAPEPQATKESASGWILGEIENASSIEALQRLWAANQSAFESEQVMDAWKARGRVLKAAE
ncbi:hypothetical protein AB0G73_10550 [Streptomyces sp. NPDC020719]|uniref:hypothetical protein n=1 Tax=Streptomyces sp. NPDC020719 TaxID=3154896 RepID=UPI0033FF4835